MPAISGTFHLWPAGGFVDRRQGRRPRHAILRCSLCGALWNHARIKCRLCGPTGGIAWQGVEGDAGIVNAETCDRCRGYVKILYRRKEPALDRFADDIGTVALDLLAGKAGYRRGAFNPLLLGY